MPGLWEIRGPQEWLSSPLLSWSSEVSGRARQDRERENVFAVHASLVRICGNISSKLDGLEVFVLLHRDFHLELLFSPASTQFCMIDSSWWGLEQEILQVRMQKHYVGEAFLVPTRIHQSQGTLPLTLRTKAKPHPQLAVGLASFLPALYNTQPHAHFLWGSICQTSSHILTVWALLRRSRELEQHLDSPL